MRLPENSARNTTWRCRWKSGPKSDMNSKQIFASIVHPIEEMHGRATDAHLGVNKALPSSGAVSLSAL